MNKPLLTVAIPAYNVELYIEETVSSILKSKYTNDIEIIIVNDGSTDSTLEISNNLSSKYPCVKVINKNNGGHGSAINYGIKYATGKYFRLLDGDDWFDASEFDKYIELLKKEEADIVFTDLMECFIKNNFNRPVTYYSHLPEYKMLELDNISFPKWGPMLPTTTIKTTLLKKSNFKIDEHCYYVDQEYNLACYLYAKTATYYPLMIYHYRLERDGQSMEKNSLIKNVASHEKVCTRLLKEYHKHLPSLSQKRQDYISNRMIIPMCHMQYFIAIEWCKSKQHFLSFDKTLRKYPQFYNNPNIAGSLTTIHRKTNGILVKLDSFLRPLARLKNKLSNNTDANPANKKTRFLVFLSIIAIIFIANAIVVNYVLSEHTIYYWDLSGYWKNSIDLLGTFRQNPISGFKSILDSMNTDYNYLPLVPMLPFLFIFGTSRLSFILIVLNLYILPFAIIMYFTSKTLISKTRFVLRSYTKPLLFSVFMLAPTVLIPALNGRPDAICLVVIALIFYYLAKTQLECISNYFVLAILVFILIILRRYFAFLGISIYIAILITKTIQNFKHFDNKTALAKSIKVSIKLFASGIVVLLLMFVFSKDLLIRYLTGNYNDVYSGYLLGSFFDQILLFVQYYGILFLALAILGIIISHIKYRKTVVSEISAIGLISSLLCFVLFTRVQTLGDQHMYMFVPFFTLSISILIITLSNHKKQWKIASLIPPTLIILLSLYSFTGTRTTNCSNLCYITGISEKIRPTIRSDIETIDSMRVDLENLMTNADYLYILSSSDAFNDDLFKNINLPSYPKINISGVKHVDKRDGFPYYFFDATYIAVADPIQTHLLDGSQEVISYLAKQILSNKVNNLSLIKSYNIDNNVTIKLFHKDSPYDEQFLIKTKEHFKLKYPNYPILFESIPTQDSNH